MSVIEICRYFHVVQTRTLQCLFSYGLIIFALLLGNPSFALTRNPIPYLDVGTTSAQTTLSGIVKDSRGNPIQGVTVQEKGRQNSTTTDEEGQFSLRVTTGNAVLVFSSMGYIVVELPANQVAEVRLEDDQSELEEVVVVGYGTQKRSNVTAAVTQVDTRVLRDRPAPTVTNMLQGAAPGLTLNRSSGRPGAQGLQMQIRGAASANGASPPLIVIDGVISSEQAFTAINPSDIANISLLKDGAAAAIYGAQSGGGVLLITTKRGEPGKPRISVSSNMAFQRPGNIPGRLSLIDEMNYVNLARANAGLPPEYQAIDLERALGNQVFYVGPNNQWETYNQEDLISTIVRNSYPLFTNNASVSGGSEDVQYLMSVGNMTQSGMFKVGDDRYSRWNARANFSARINPYLKLDLQNAYINEAIDNPSTGEFAIDEGGNSILRQFYSSRMRFPLYNPDGTYYANGTSSTFGYALLRDGGYDQDRIATYTNNVTATIDNLLEGFKVRLMYSREQRNFQKDLFRRTVTYFSGPDMGNQSWQNRPNNFSIDNQSQLIQNYQAIADYSKTFADKHDFGVMAGYQFLDQTFNHVVAESNNLFVNDNPSLNFVDNPINRTNNQQQFASAMQSYFGRINYAFAEKYLLEATVRIDESSRLSPANRTNTFPGISAGWNVMKEDWSAGIGAFFQELKPRVSWGRAGLQEGIGYFDFITQLGMMSDLLLNNQQQAYLQQRTLPGRSMGWEVIETRNIGVDFSVLNRKIRGSFDYFHKNNNNMLVPLTLPGTIGLGIPFSNDGRLQTRGWEAELVYSDRFWDKLDVRIGANMTDNTNTLVQYAGINDVVNLGVNSLIEGYALNSVWGYRTDGFFQNQQEVANAPSYQRVLNRADVPSMGDLRYVDINGDGEISPGTNRLSDLGDMVHFGDLNPRYQFGFNLYVGYKNFDFSAFIQGTGMQMILPGNEFIQPQMFPWYQPMNFHADYWTPENRNAYFPRPFTGGNHNFVSSDRWILNAAYARLKNIQIGYTLNRQEIPKLPFQRMRVFFSGEDLLTVSRLPRAFRGVIDPEMDTRPTNAAAGTVNRQSPYPFATTLSFGLNIDF
ncbi:TonB-dependent receptor [Sphingobacterium sp. lm-10]|uniref:SusC/RagA family TonB-linked outer membrane protein n=1 Tax=Sphingobacterium sp. lm-10 TaxID=2944904 RepID=UPI0020209B7F|nr:TonB-dependent receptor [Sphingobacterium sp. lm-10]MCL7988735.1 TonB-dependent receptor [Sphingobacterium sp. lm-10]